MPIVGMVILSSLASWFSPCQNVSIRGKGMDPKVTFRVLDALPYLVETLGPTINKVPDNRRRFGLENMKAMGFRTPSGRVLALDVYPENLERVRIWIEPLGPPVIADIETLRGKRCADLQRRELSALADGKGTYIELKTRMALETLVDWYLDGP